MPSPAMSDSSHMVMDDLPLIPSKRRLSARAWEVVWTIQMLNPLRTPDTLNKFVAQFNDDRCVFRAKLRTVQRLALSVTSENTDDETTIEQAFTVLRAIERQYGPIQLIENRPVEQWPLRD